MNKICDGILIFYSDTVNHKCISDWIREDKNEGYYWSSFGTPSHIKKRIIPNSPHQIYCEIMFCINWIRRAKFPWISLVPLKYDFYKFPTNYEIYLHSFYKQAKPRYNFPFDNPQKLAPRELNDFTVYIGGSKSQIKMRIMNTSHSHTQCQQY